MIKFTGFGIVIATHDHQMEIAVYAPLGTEPQFHLPVAVPAGFETPRIGTRFSIEFKEEGRV